MTLPNTPIRPFMPSAVGQPYLNGLPWSDWSRDERFFCGALYGHISQNPTDFADWLIDHLSEHPGTGRPAVSGISKGGRWDAGYEVCFYRDYLWQQRQSARAQGLSAKRTFDLCLFGERDIVVIEAKVCEPFSAAQNKAFEDDFQSMGKLPGMAGIRLHLVALASSRYFSNARKHGLAGTLDVFQNQHISWADVATKYHSDPLLQRADALYKPERLFPGHAGG